MRKRITKLVCVGIACFCIVSAMGQELNSSMRRIEAKDYQKDDMKLRASNEVEYWWPDSVITYNYIGEPTFKVYYDKENQTSTYAYLEDDIWIINNTRGSNGYYLMSPPTKIYFSDSDDHDYFSLQMTNIWTIGSIIFEKDRYTYEAKYDNKGNIILLEVTPIGLSRVSYTFRIGYIGNNNPVLYEMYWYDTLIDKSEYKYNEKGYLIQFKDYHNYNIYNNETILMELIRLETVKFDEKGRPIAGYNLWIKFEDNSEYTLFYYPDGTDTPNVEADNNNPVGSDNKGGFDLDVNIPIDSISNGSITIQFPEGFTLDENNTTLTLDFSDRFELIITRQEDNSWLLEIKPKTSKSATLRAGEAKKMIQIAYNVNESVENGTYNISVNSILFETPGGDLIPEPAITVPAELDRTVTGIAAVENSNVWASGGNLCIRTDKACTVYVYTVLGQIVRQQTVGPGETMISLPQGLYFVKTDEVTKKIIVRLAY